jgi:hypothetical protein
LVLVDSPPSPVDVSLCMQASLGSCERNIQYVLVEVGPASWEVRRPVEWPNINFPNDWHLNARRILVPSMPLEG